MFWIEQGQLTSVFRVITLPVSSGRSIPFPSVSRTVPHTGLELMSPARLPSFVPVGPGPGSPSQNPGRSIAGLGGELGVRGGRCGLGGANILERKILFPESRAAQDSGWGMTAKPSLLSTIQH